MREGEFGTFNTFQQFHWSAGSQKNCLRGSWRITDGNLVNTELMEAALLGNLTRSKLTLIRTAVPAHTPAGAGLARLPNLGGRRVKPSSRKRH